MLPTKSYSRIHLCPLKKLNDKGVGEQNLSIIKYGCFGEVEHMKNQLYYSFQEKNQERKKDVSKLFRFSRQLRTKFSFLPTTTLLCVYVTAQYTWLNWTTLCLQVHQRALENKGETQTKQGLTSLLEIWHFWNPLLLSNCKICDSYGTVW